MVRLAVEVTIRAVTVVCRSCGTAAVLTVGDENRTVTAWAASHQQPYLTHLLSSINGGPLEPQVLSRPRLLR